LLGRTVGALKSSAFTMSIRGKILLVFLLCGIVPLLAVSALYWRDSARAAEQFVRADIEGRVRLLERALENSLAEREADLKALAAMPAVSEYAHGAGATASVSDTPDKAVLSLPEGVAAAFASLLKNEQDDYASLMLVAAGSRPLLRAEPPLQPGRDAVRLQTENFWPGQWRVDERVWALTEPKLLRAPVSRESFGAGVAYVVPVFAGSGGGRNPVGAVVAVLKFNSLLQKAARSVAAPDVAGDGRESEHPEQIVAVDREGQIVFHTNEAVMYQPAASTMPHFAPIARDMAAGASGTRFYRAPPHGDQWLAACRPLPELGLSLGVAGNYSAAVAGVRGGAGWLSFSLAGLVALVGAGLIFVIVNRTAQRIDRVAAAATAIARGNLDQRILVQSSDETNKLAESFNLMSDRLREQIARAAETKQFESFMRLSAMLTHDLKNSITGLSMLVNNMERQFHREEFRADAIHSLREATDKLRAIVSRLSEPVKTLSGEYRRTQRPADLVPVIRRALAATAEPVAHFYDLETQLPETLTAPIDPDRMERVVENLVINALEAMGAKGGRLIIAAGTEGSGYVFFSVADSGIGMTEEFIRTRLFRAFATTKSKGIGLGLYTCREIVESHGGRLDVNSELGRGTTFRVVLPAGA